MKNHTTMVQLFVEKYIYIYIYIEQYIENPDDGCQMVQFGTSSRLTFKICMKLCNICSLSLSLYIYISLLYGCVTAMIVSYRSGLAQTLTDRGSVYVYPRALTVMIQIHTTMTYITFSFMRQLQTLTTIMCRENYVWVGVANSLCGHESVILLFISRVANNRNNKQ